ncbi:MAG: carboxymuconolactone decarboxylase family protein, partial [Gammaproteobacteria bacterium]
MDDEQRYVNGMATRREVLGEAYVDRAEAAKTDFTAEFQAFITRYAWGDVWQRPGLDRRTRSFITLSMLLALDRADEFMLHVRG